MKERVALCSTQRSHPRAGVIGVALLLLAGCAGNMGAQAIRAQHGDYNVALQRVSDQQGRDPELVEQRVAAPELAQLLQGFGRMLRPHAAREDTVLFPAFRGTMGAAAYHELGEQFEGREHERFGEHGFADVVAEIARFEAMLGIADLGQFTLA